MSRSATSGTIHSASGRSQGSASSPGTGPAAAARGRPRRASPGSAGGGGVSPAVSDSCRRAPAGRGCRPIAGRTDGSARRPATASALSPWRTRLSGSSSTQIWVRICSLSSSLASSASCATISAGASNGTNAYCSLPSHSVTSMVTSKVDAARLLLGVDELGVLEAPGRIPAM